MLKKINLLVLLVLTCVALLVLPVVAQASESPVVIYFFPGGAAGGTFATVVYNGAKVAEEVLGDRVEVRYLWSVGVRRKWLINFSKLLRLIQMV